MVTYVWLSSVFALHLVNSGMTNYPTGPNRTTSDPIGPHIPNSGMTNYPTGPNRTTSDPIGLDKIPSCML